MGNVTHGFDPQVGDQGAVYYYSDVHPCTVIKRTKKFVTVQMDDYKLNKDSKREELLKNKISKIIKNFPK